MYMHDIDLSESDADTSTFQVELSIMDQQQHLEGEALLSGNTINLGIVLNSR